MDIPSQGPKPTAQNKKDAERLANFVLFTQRSVILNLSPELNKGNVSFPQFLLLTHLASVESMTMGDVNKKMGHSAAASTGMIDRLEKMKLVGREYGQEDRRKIMVHITQKGVEFVAKMRKEISQDLQAIFKLPL